MTLMRAINVSPNQLVTLFQPFGGLPPATEAQFFQLRQNLRRQGHILENAHGNIGAMLKGAPKQARPGAYFAGDDDIGNDPIASSSTSSAHLGPTANTGWGRVALTAAQNQPVGVEGSWEGIGAGMETTGSVPTNNFPAYLANDDDSWSTGTDTDTSSDDGAEALDLPDLSQMTREEATEHLYWQYRTAKKTWRRFAGKPVRKFRRKFRRSSKGRGKGKGRSKKGSRNYMFTKDDVQTFLAGKGKGGRSHSSGKGFGRKQNPRDKSGNIMRCRICNSEEHFAAQCPQAGSAKGSSK